MSAASEPDPVGGPVAAGKYDGGRDDQAEFVYIRRSHVTALREPSERVDRFVEAFIRWDQRYDQLTGIATQLEGLGSALENAMARSLVGGIRRQLRDIQMKLDDELLGFEQVATFKRLRQEVMATASSSSSPDLALVVDDLVSRVNDLADTASEVRSRCEEEATKGVKVLCAGIGLVLEFLEQGIEGTERDLPRPGGPEKSPSRPRGPVMEHGTKPLPGGQPTWTTANMNIAPKERESGR